MDIVSQISRPLVVGGASALYAMTMGGDGNMQVFGRSMSIPLTFAATQIAAQYGGELLAGYVAPKLAPAISGSFAESLVLPASSGLLFAGLFAVDSNANEFWKLFLVGSAIEIGANYVYDNFVKPIVNQGISAM